VSTRKEDDHGARIDVHGGDFPKGGGSFHTSSGFLLIDRDGKPETIPLSQLGIADHASEISLAIVGASASTRAQFERAAAAPGQRMFIAVFADGRQLLASTDPKTFEEICAPRGS
jgi:hypothetical protein